MMDSRTRTVEIGASRRGLPRASGRGAPDNRPAAALPADKAEPPQAEQHLLISLPAKYSGLLLYAMHIAERHALQTPIPHADPAINLHADVKALRVLVEQQLRQQRRKKA